MPRKSNEKLWKHLINELKDFEIQAGWFETAKYADGTSVAYIAAVQNYGCTIDHPGGTPYYVNATSGLAQFVSKDSVTGRYLEKRGLVTKPHWITIPPRPFMDNAKARLQGSEGQKIIQQELLRVFEGKQTMQVAIERIGIWLQGIIQEEINNMTSPALKSSTVRAREKRYLSKKKKTSITPNHPLMDTNMMYSSVQHKAEIKQ